LCDDIIQSDDIRPDDVGFNDVWFGDISPYDRRPDIIEQAE
jgi:hypothetical protein